MTTISERSKLINVWMCISLLKGFKKEREGRKTATSAMMTAMANKEKRSAMIGLR